MNRSNREDAKLDGESAVGLDAYSQDNQFIGRVSEYLPTAHDSEMAVEWTRFDAIGRDGRVEGSRHLLIDGTGTIIQSMVIVPVESVQVDVRGRRVTVPLTIAQIEAMPHRDPTVARSEPVA